MKDEEMSADTRERRHLHTTISRPVGDAPTPRKFTVEEYIDLIDSGFFHPDEKVELIEGELINKMTIGTEHANCVTRLNKLLVKIILDRDLEVAVQNPIRLEKSRPEPDLVIHTSDSLEKGEDPSPEGIRLVVEVSDSTLQEDRNIKLPIYAKAGIQLYWIVNLQSNLVEVYSRPFGDTYNEKRVFEPGEKIPLSDFNTEVIVSDFLK